MEFIPSPPPFTLKFTSVHIFMHLRAIKSYGQMENDEYSYMFNSIFMAYSNRHKKKLVTTLQPWLNIT